MKITFWLTMETTAMLLVSHLTTSHLMQILDSRIILISSLLYVLSPCPQPTETWSLLGHPEFVLNSMPVMSLTRTVSHTPSWPNFKSWWNLEVYTFCSPHLWPLASGEVRYNFTFLCLTSHLTRRSPSVYLYHLVYPTYSYSTTQYTVLCTV